MQLVFLTEQLQALAQLIALAPHRAVCGVGRNRLAREWLCHEVAPDRPRRGHTLTVRGVRDTAELVLPGDDDASRLPGHAGNLVIGMGAAAGRFWGCVREDDTQWTQVEAIRVLGPGLPLWGKAEDPHPMAAELAQLGEIGRAHV